MTESHSSGGEGDGFEIRLLGPVQALYQDQPLNLGGLQARSILTVLMLHPGQVVPRGRIVECAWRGDPPPSARGLIADYVSSLRRALRPAITAGRVSLRAVSPGFRAEIDPGLIDVHRFAALVARAGADRAAREDGLAASHLEQALALWHGHSHALDDLEADWLRDQAAVMETQRLDALEQLAALHLAASRADRAVDLLRDHVPRHPERDELTAALVKALTATGECAQAVEAADRAVDALDQAGLPVGPRLREARRAAQRAPATRDARGALRMLPADTRAFTGREPELAELLELADTTSGETAGTLVISAIDGMAGIGKTALAIHAGHRLRGRFPDGQLFVDLHGFTQGMTPRTATDVLADLLRVFGVPPQQIPKDRDARAALYRARLTGTRTLIVLDNANSETQIRPLLPAAPECLVLVTSRLRLKGLDDAQVLSLDLLPLPDALALLRTIAGPGRIPANDPLLDQIVQWCGRLPLALRIAGALIRNRPAWTLHHLAGLLQDQHTRLTALNDHDRDLTAIFALSYTALTETQQSLFRHLGLHPGPDIDPYATAALLNTDIAIAEPLLQDLVNHNLLTESPPDRYRMHDLIRTHAQTLVVTHDPEPERTAAHRRLLRYYAHTAQTASIPIARIPRPKPDGPAPVHAPTLHGSDAARTWLRTEYPNLEAAFTHSATHTLDEHTIALAAGLTEILLTDGPWSRALEIHQAAANAAERRKQPTSRATALVDLGWVRFLTGDYRGAEDALTSALGLCRSLGNHTGEAAALTVLGQVRSLTGDYSGADNALTRALELCLGLGDRLGETTALTSLGQVRSLTGDYRGAEDAFTSALGLCRSLGNHAGEANALTALGRVRILTGDFPRADDALTCALNLFRALGNRHGEANALTELGQVRHLTRDYPGADDALTRALELCRALGNRNGEAIALTELGQVRHLTRDYPGADDALTCALKLFRGLGNRGDEAWALNYYAATVAALGDRSRSRALYERALAMNRELNKPDDEAISLEGIADHHLAYGDTIQGAEHLHQALQIYQRLGMRADIERVRARLAELDAA